MPRGLVGASLLQILSVLDTGGRNGSRVLLTRRLEWMQPLRDGARRQAKLTLALHCQPVLSCLHSPAVAAGHSRRHARDQTSHMWVDIGMDGIAQVMRRSALCVIRGDSKAWVVGLQSSHLDIRLCSLPVLLLAEPAS